LENLIAYALSKKCVIVGISAFNEISTRRKKARIREAGEKMIELMFTLQWEREQFIENNRNENRAVGHICAKLKASEGFSSVD